MPFEFLEFVDRADGKQLYTTAVAGVELDGMKGDVIVLHEEKSGEPT